MDAAYAVDANIEAAEAVKKAKDNLEKIKKLHSQGKATADAVKDAEISLAAATANLAFVTQATSQSMMNAKNTVPTLGFYAEAGVTKDTTKTETTASSVVNTGSNIIAEKDINLNAGNDLNQIGSLVISNTGNIDYNAGRDLNLQASKDMYHSDSKTSENSISAGASTKSGAYGSIGTGKSNSKENVIEYNNSGSYAEEGKISYNVAGNMNADGYNALAKDIDVNVGGDMNLASKQNESHANSSSNSYNAGFGGGAPTGGFGQSNGESDRQWVDNQTSIVGTESVDIDVDGKLKMDGSLIANIDKDGKDAGNLDIKAGSLEANDIYNYDRNSDSGISVNTNFGGNPVGTNDGYDDGKTHLVITDNGYEKEGVTHATIGKGNIEVADGGDISDINRDINKTETITKDQVTGALDVDLTINHSIVTDGPQKLVDDIADYPENLYGASDKLALLGVNAAGAGYAGIGLLTNPFGSNIYYKDGVYHITGNLLGIDTAAITLGNIAIYFGKANPNDFGGSYLGIPVFKGFHEAAHAGQWNEMGAFGFIDTWIQGGGPTPQNPIESSADRDAFQKTLKYGKYKYFRDLLNKHYEQTHINEVQIKESEGAPFK